MIVRTITWKIITTVLCCIVYDSLLYTMIYAHTHEQFLKPSLGLGLVFVCLFRFNICVFFLDYSVIVLFPFAVLA